MAMGIYRSLALLLAALCLAPHSAGKDASVMLGEQKLLGEWRDNIAVFKGIPFAEPPVGELRWQATVAPVLSPGERPAREFAPACMQGEQMVQWYRDVAGTFGAAPGVVEDIQVSEDCLYLNVWTPTLGKQKNLPVMVWMHGGSNKGGWSYEPNYLGEKLAQKDVVVVTISYRLGVFGFFSHPQLSRQQAVSANFALLDQIAALQWVQQNIHQFGGDPARVTLFGESAGAADIGYLMASPLAVGLFHRAIHQSAGFEMLNRETLDDEQQRGLMLGLQLDIANDSSAISKLRAVSAGAILAAAEQANADHYYDPVIDKHLLMASAFERFAAGEQLPVPLLIGTNADEWYMYVEEGADEKALDDFISSQPSAIASKLKQAVAGEQDIRQAIDRLRTAKQMLCPSRFMAGQTAEVSHSWVYYFSMQRQDPGGEQLKAYHGAEIPYVFNTHDEWLPTTAMDLQLTDTMMTYWVNFAYTGNPNGDGLVRWPEYRKEDSLSLELGNKIQSINAPESLLCKVLIPTGH